MLLFLDTADIDAIKEFAFLINGVTTTPTIIKRDTGLTSEEFMTKVRNEFPDLEIHVEALAKTANETEKLIDSFLSKPWYNADKVAFKVPISKEGLEATKNIKHKDSSVKINLHMAFSAAQASLAMLTKPDYIAPLIGRYADKVAELNAHGKRSHGNDAGYDMLEGIMTCKRAMGSDSIILASSIRTVHDFVIATKLGADAVTLPPAVLRDALEHPMTVEGVKKFWKDLG